MRKLTKSMSYDDVLLRINQIIIRRLLNSIKEKSVFVALTAQDYAHANTLDENFITDKVLFSMRLYSNDDDILIKKSRSDKLMNDTKNKTLASLNRFDLINVSQSELSYSMSDNILDIFDISRQQNLINALSTQNDDSTSIESFELFDHFDHEIIESFQFFESFESSDLFDLFEHFTFDHESDASSAKRNKCDCINDVSNE
jgi:hypothetical protein